MASGQAKPSRRPAKVGRAAKQSSSDLNAWTPLRKTGIRVIADMPWGAHICLFYETKEDLLDTNAAYIKAGLESNEFCVWAISEPITEDEAWAALHRDVPDLDGREANESIGDSARLQLVPARATSSIQRRSRAAGMKKLQFALDRGFDGLRISGNAFWIEQQSLEANFANTNKSWMNRWKDRAMLVLCTYSLSASRAVDLLDVARAHQFTVARRRGQWEFLETPELKRAKQEIKSLGDALLVLSRPFAGHKLLTSRERIVLAQIVRGASSKGAARWLERQSPHD